MKRQLVFCIICSLVLVGCSDKPLKRNGWEKSNYKCLNSLINTYGSSSRTYDSSNRPYAVFDFDDTSIFGDVTLAVMADLIDDFRLQIPPEDIESVLLQGVPDVNKELDGTEGVTAAMLAKDISADYKILSDKYSELQKGRKSLDEILKKLRKTDEFQDYRAKIWALSAGVDYTFGYNAGCLWVINVFNSMTEEEVAEAAKQTARRYLIEGRKMHGETWESPDMGLAGKVKVQLRRGMGVSAEMKDLFHTLNAAGFDVYICSASAEVLVEAVACDSSFGLDFDKDKVFGLRMRRRADGCLATAYIDDYEQPIKEGKVQCIRRYMAPSHGGAEPVLTGGDSNGDFQMLSELPNTKLALVINRGATGDILSLYDKALGDSRKGKAALKGGTHYMLQGIDAGKIRFRKSNKSKP